MSDNSDFCFVQYNGYTKREGVIILKVLISAVF